MRKEIGILIVVGLVFLVVMGLFFIPESRQVVQDIFGESREPLLAPVASIPATGNISMTELWNYSSETSATIYWRTNISAYSYVEYGLAPSSHGAYSNQTTQQGDNWMHAQGIVNHTGYYSHFHQIRDLSRNTLYYYRVVSVDPNTLEETYSNEMVFNTADIAGKIVINSVNTPTCQESGGSWYEFCITSPGTYVLDQDYVANAGGIYILADDVTIDLDGHVLTYNNVPDGTLRQRVGIVIRSPPPSRPRILNGIIRQGAGNDNASSSTIGHNPIYLQGASGGEVAGMKLEWNGTQISGLFINNAVSNARIHHNFLNDLGTGITNRHQLVKSVFFTSVINVSADHNIINRTRQVGIFSQGSLFEIYGNEIYVDSWATNGMGIGTYPSVNSFEIMDNKVYGTGYHAIGIYPHGGSSDAKIYNNYIDMFAGLTENRWSEYGDISVVVGMRTMWANPKNLSIYNNTIIVSAANGGRARGTQFYIYPNTAPGPDFYNNTVISFALDNTVDVSSVRGQAQGSSVPSTGLLEYSMSDNILASDILPVAFADDGTHSSIYGVGSNITIRDSIIRRIGANPNYHTVRIGTGTIYDSVGNRFLDNTLENGANLSDYLCIGFGDDEFASDWTLPIDIVDGAYQHLTGAQVTITDNFSSIVYQGTSTGSTIYKVIREFLVNMDSLTTCKKTTYSNYTVQVDYGGVTQIKEVDLNGITQPLSPLVFSFATGFPTSSNTECEINTPGNWMGCGNLSYNDNLLQVRALCDDTDGTITKANFTLKNIEDNKFIAQGEQIGSGVASEVITIDFVDVSINDSGNFDLDVKCYDNESRFGAEVSSWFVPWGSLSVVHNSPPSGSAYSNGTSFSYSTTLNCNGGECGDVTAILDPQLELSSATGDVLEDTYSRPGGTGYGVNDFVVAGTWSNFRPYSAWLKIDISSISSIPSDWTVSNATLRLYHYTDTGGTHTGESFSVYGVLDQGWSETLCFDSTTNCPLIDQELSTGIISGGVNGGVFWQDLPIANITWLQQQIDSGLPNVTFMFNRTYASVATESYGSFRSKEYVDPAFGPKLILDFIDPHNKGGVIPMNSGNPFYTTSQNPTTCNNMIGGDSCTTTWNVFANGTETWYNFFVIYNATNPAVTDVNSSLINISIGAGGGQPPVCNDVNSDGKVNVIDLAIVIFNQGRGGADYAHLDRNNDSVIDMGDVNSVIGNFGKSC